MEMNQAEEATKDPGLYVSFPWGRVSFQTMEEAEVYLRANPSAKLEGVATYVGKVT